MEGSTINYGGFNMARIEIGSILRDVRWISLDGFNQHEYEASFSCCHEASGDFILQQNHWMYVTH